MNNTLSLTLGAVRVGGGGPSLDLSITPPVLTLAVGATTYPPQFDVSFDETVAVGDTLELEWTANIRFTSIVGSANNLIDSGEAAANAASFTGLSSIVSPNIYYYRLRVVKPNGNFSAWSNTVLHGQAIDSTPAAFSFTDQNNVALSTLVESNTITLTGFNQPITGDAGGAEYSVNEGSGFGPWITTVGRTFFPGDQVRVRATSSGSNSTAVNVTFTAGGVSDTFTITTLAAPVSLPTSGLILRLDADDLSTLWQTITGTTAPVDGQPIGTWQDKSGNNFHFAAAANDTTRPTYRENSGLPFVEFDGVNDILFRLANLGLWSNGAATVMIATRAPTPAANNLGLFMQGSTTDNDPVYSIVTYAGLDDVGMFLRNDAAVTLLANPLISTTGLDNNDAVITLTDDGANVIGYDDATAGATRTYTRAGNTLTLNTTAIGGWRRAAAGSWFNGRVYAVAVWNRVLTAPERAQALTYMGSKQGRSI